MSKLTIISSENMEKLLKHLGFIVERQKGSHKFFKHPDGRTAVVPFHKGEDLGRGLIRSILNDIDITIDEYEILRKEL